MPYSKYLIGCGGCGKDMGRSKKDFCSKECVDKFLRRCDRIYAHNKKIEAEKRKNRPHFYKAHPLVAKAVKKKMIKKTRCMICGASKVVGHHYDYKHPLDVIWLCHKHHARWHGALKRMGHKI